jgi:hypothetical protein
LRTNGTTPKENTTTPNQLLAADTLSGHRPEPPSSSVVVVFSVRGSRTKPSNR